MLFEAHYDDYTMTNTATEVQSNKPRLLTGHNEIEAGQITFKKGFETVRSQGRLSMEQAPSSPLLYTARLVENRQYERIDAQPVRVLNEVSNFQAYYALTTTALYQTFENLDCMKSQRSPHHDLVNQPQASAIE